VRTVLDRAAKTIGARFANQPREEAAIRLTIANAYAALGNWPEARIHAERSVELLTATRGADHADTLTSNNVLAELLFFQYEVKRAVALFEEVVRRRTATLGPDHPDTLASKDRLAFVYQQDGSADGPDRAAVLLQEVVEKRTVLLGPNNLGTLYSKASLAWVYQKQGKLELAEAMYVELLKVFTDKFGADRPSTVHIRMNLGLIYLIGEKLDQAEPHLLSVLQKAKSLYGEDHYRTAVTKSYVARLYRKQRKYDHAARLYEEILAKSKAKPGANDQFAPLVLGELALTHLEAKKLDKALPLIGEIVSGQGHQPVAEIPQFAGLLERIGLQLVEHEQYLQAENLLGRSLAIREKKVPDDWSTFSTKSALGAALMGQKQYDKAEPLLFDGYHGMRQREDKIPTTVRKNRLVDALDRLVQLYDNWNKPDEAAKWRKELDFRKSSDKK
jgi:tetratricopeptide (TPR) repeat protein